jgi:hypothetical protein
MRFFRQDSPDEPPVPDFGEEDADGPCQSCGWAPEVSEFYEVIVAPLGR